MFSAFASSIPAVNPTINSARITYFYTPVDGGIQTAFSVDSNDVSVKILTNVGTVVTRCCGEATITPGFNIDGGIPNGNCDFTIRHKIGVKAPVKFGEKVE
jgi:hypothetical protein